MTPADYLEIERHAGCKSEYYQGQVFPMAGATGNHSLIVSNLTSYLNQQLRTKGCEVFPVNMRLQVAAAAFYTYPDVAVVCGRPEFADDQLDTLLNPVLVMEVASDSTADYDRGCKFERYRSLPSLVEYVTIAQDRAHIEQYTRQDNHWFLTEYQDRNQTIQFSSVNTALALVDVYAKVDFDR